MMARLQRLWWTFAAAVTVLCLLGALLADTTSTVPAALPVALVLALGAATHAGVVVVDRGLYLSAPANDERARREVRARLAMQISIAEAPALLAFALAFVLGPSWVVLVGGAVSIATLLRVRPSSARLADIEQVWRRAGSDATLRAAGE